MLFTAQALEGFIFFPVGRRRLEKTDKLLFQVLEQCKAIEPH